MNKYSKGIFITGTDTGVGKTIVSAVIIRALINKGIKVGAMKPMESGCAKSENGKTLIPSDGLFLKEMSQMDEPVNIVTPLCFELPLAPMIASSLEGIPVDLDLITNSYEAASGRYDFMVVDGVGGLLVPIKNGYFVTDLIKRLNLPVIVVARPSLGTINHTLLTVNHALREGIAVKGVIINFHKPAENTIAERTNPDALRKLCPVPVLGVLPYLKDINIANIDMIASDFSGIADILEV